VFLNKVDADLNEMRRLLKEMKQRLNKMKCELNNIELVFKKRDFVSAATPVVGRQLSG